MLKFEIVCDTVAWSPRVGLLLNTFFHHLQGCNQALKEETEDYQVAGIAVGVVCMLIEVGSTVMRIIKLNLFPDSVPFRPGYRKLKPRRYFTIFCDI